MVRRTRRFERGAAAVEMAIVLPVLILLIGGIIDFGRAFMSQVILTNAAREGTRVAVLTKDASQLGNITTRAQAAADLNPMASATVSVSPSTGCTTNGYTGNVTVTVTAQFQWFFLSALPGSMPTSLTGKSVQGC